MRLGWITIITIVAALGSLTAHADIAPALTGSGPWAGEATLRYHGPGGPSTVAHVDWIVLAPGTYNGPSNPYGELVKGAFGDTRSTEYLYAYQLESKFLLSGLDIFTVDASHVTNANWMAGGRDLDAPTWGYHDTLNPFFANLAGEQENGTALKDAVSAQIDLDNVTWQWSQAGGGAIYSGQESTIVWFTSPYAPTYVGGHTADTRPESQGHGDVPGPRGVPAPGGFILGTIGLGMIGWIKRRLA